MKWEEKNFFLLILKKDFNYCEEEVFFKMFSLGFSVMNDLEEFLN